MLGRVVGTGSRFAFPQIATAWVWGGGNVALSVSECITPDYSRVQQQQYVVSSVGLHTASTLQMKSLEIHS